MKHLSCAVFLVMLCIGLFNANMRAQSSMAAEIDRRAQQVANKVVGWRRDFHEHPELGNRETRTAKIVADHLRSLGIEVRTNVAHTGVVGVLRGGPSTALGAGKPGKVVALRADMDALPVTEQVNLPFASKVKATYNGQLSSLTHHSRIRRFVD